MRSGSIHHPPAHVGERFIVAIENPWLPMAAGGGTWRKALVRRPGYRLSKAVLCIGGLLTLARNRSPVWKEETMGQVRWGRTGEQNGSRRQKKEKETTASALALTLVFWQRDLAPQRQSRVVAHTPFDALVVMTSSGCVSVCAGMPVLFLPACIRAILAPISAPPPPRSTPPHIRTVFCTYPRCRFFFGIFFCLLVVLPRLSFAPWLGAGLKLALETLG